MNIYYIKNSFQNIINSEDYAINHHYLERYIKIISKFKERNLLNTENLGFHRHHIVPRCLNGTNEEINLVTLSPREHFIIHHLLWKSFPQTGLTFAFHLMVHGSKRYGSNKITSKVYEQLCLDNSFIRKGKEVSEETRKKISDANKGRKMSEESKLKISEAKKGKKRSEETRRKLSESHKVENLSEETRRKMSEGQKGKKRSEESVRKSTEGNRGKKRSEETRRKISDSNKGQKRSKENRRNMSNSQKGRRHSEETKLKISEANKGKKQSEETRRKMSEGQKGKKVSEETNKRMSEAQKNRPKKIWVCSSSCSRLIQKELLEEFLSNGFILGRKLK